MKKGILKRKYKRQRAARSRPTWKPPNQVARKKTGQRVRLENEVLAATVRAQRLFGQELHDGLSQQLTGLKFKLTLLEHRLRSTPSPEADAAQAISALLDEAIDEAGNLARSAHPVEPGPRGLMAALRALAVRAEQKHRIKCVCFFHRPVFVRDNNVATHAYRIAEEAVCNAVKHGEPTEILISVREARGNITLKIEDNGTGLPDGFFENGWLGLRIMRYRAQMIHGSVRLRRNPSRGAAVVCTFKKK